MMESILKTASSSRSSLPRGTLSYNTVLEFLKGYLNAGANERFVSSSEAAEILKVRKENVSRNVGFLTSFGFLVEEEGKPRGGCKITPKASQFIALFKMNPRGEQTRRIMGEIIKDRPAVKVALGRISNEGKLAVDDLASLLVLETADHKAKRNEVEIFIDMLVYGNLIKIEDGFATIPVEGEIVPLPTEAVSSVVRKTKDKHMKKKQLEHSLVEGPLGIQNLPVVILGISQDTPREKVKEIVKAALEGYDEYFEEKQKSKS